ncbi:MAG: multiheme c-type cytochrome [Candidatus Latescibacterota bacterium]
MSETGEPIILCSAGDFYGGADPYNEPKSHFVAEMMGYFMYDAVAVGETDLNYGLAALIEDRDAYDLNLICANLFFTSDKEKPRTSAKLKRPFPPYVVVNRGGVKIGFIALLSPATKMTNMRTDTEEEVESLTYIIKDPVPFARELVPQLKKKCDVLVMLAHMEKSELEQFLPDLPEVDIAVLGHSERAANNEEPYLFGTVPVYMASNQGQYIGRLLVTIDPEGKIADTRNKIYFLDANYPDDPVVAEMVGAFEEEYKSLQKEIYAKEMLRESHKQGGGEVYLGLGSCQGCHVEEFDSYLSTAHAHAYETLSKQHHHRDSNCIGCHSVGYGERGGFSGVRVIGSAIDLIDVQCEACHGPGTKHSRDGQYNRNAVESCTSCHTPEQDPDFDFETAWKQIAH